MKSLCLLFVFFLFSSLVQAKKGILDLDEITFDKVVDGSQNTLVAFLEYSWKDPAGYEAIVFEFPDLLVSKVDSKGNEKLIEKYSITQYPTFAYFPKGSTTPALHVGEPQGEEIMDFVRVQQNPSLLKLKTLANGFLKNKDKRASDLKEAQSIVNSITDESNKKYASFFTHAMQKVIEKGDDYISNEVKRLNGLIENKSTKDDKKREFLKRVSVLKVFLGE